MDKHNVPDFLQEMLLKQYGQNITDTIIKGYLTQGDVTLRVNTIKSDIEEIMQILNANKIEFEQVNWNKDALIIKNITEQEIRKLEIYEQGKIYLQSLSSMMPPIILEPKEKETILNNAGLRNRRFRTCF